jgi:hypothetical protein
MKTLPFVVSLAAALIAIPAFAQQGPAGVPGAPGLAPPPPAAVAAPQPEPVKAAPVAAPEKCAKTKSGKTAKSCKPKKTSAQSCGAAADPARCEQYRKTREACKNLPERDYRQCLRDNLTSKK